jgi:hypothetical protein
MLIGVCYKHAVCHYYLLKIILLLVIMPSVMRFNVFMLKNVYVWCPYVRCNNTKYHYIECYYVKCCHAECHGAEKMLHNTDITQLSLS